MLELLKNLVEFGLWEIMITLFVAVEMVISILTYREMKRKKGRPRKSRAERMLEKLSKKLHVRVEK